MKRKHYTEEQIISILKEHEAGAGIALIPNFVCGDALASGAQTKILPDWSVPPAC